MSVKLSPLFQDAQLDDNGNPLAGGKIYWYFANTSTPATTYTTIAGDVAQTNPIILNSRGEPASPIWITTGSSYKAVLKDSVDATIRTIDYITGVGDSTSVTSEWAELGIVPTYLTGSSFAVAGDQTVVLHPGIRIKTTNTGGFLYGFIKSSNYSAPDTTVIVSLSTSSFLDSGLSKIEYGIISSNYPSTPGKIDATTGNIFWKNYIINGNFSQWPRGTTITANQTGPTKWSIWSNGTTKSATQQAWPDGTDIKYRPQYYMQYAVTSVAGDGNYAFIEQRVRDPRTLSGGYATLTFWAKEVSGKNIAVQLRQDFGTGGSPSEDVDILPISGAGIVDLTANWAFYSVTFSVPSVDAKSFGTTSNTAYLGVRVWFDAGINFNTQASSLGQQSGTFSIGQVSLVGGIYPIEIPQPSTFDENLLCTPWTRVMPFIQHRGYDGASQTARVTIPFPEMAGTPVIFGAPTFTETNCSSSSFEISDARTGFLNTTVTSLGHYTVSTNVNAVLSAEILE